MFFPSMFCECRTVDTKTVGRSTVIPQVRQGPCNGNDAGNRQHDPTHARRLRRRRLFAGALIAQVDIAIVVGPSRERSGPQDALNSGVLLDPPAALVALSHGEFLSRAS